MKRFYLLLTAASLLAAIAGCQKEPAGVENASQTDVYVEFTINFADGSATKADDYNSSNVAIGTEDEHAVKNAYLYFFNSTSKEYVSTVPIAAGDIASQEVAGNLIKKTTIPTRLTPATYDVYATLNYEVTGLSGKTTEGFEKMTYTHDYSTYVIGNDGIPMTSRKSDGTMSMQNVLVDANNTFDNPVPIELYMERMLAKLTVKEADSDGTYNVTTERDGSGTALATVDLTDYKPVNLTKNSYLFRHVGVDASTTTFEEITSTNYVIEPETSIKTDGTITLSHHYYQHVNGSDAYSLMPALNSFSDPLYCTENTMLQSSQKKTYATALAFKGKITPAADTYFYNNGGTIETTTPGADADLWYFNGKFYDTLESLNTHNGLSLSDTPTDPNHYQKFGVKLYTDSVCYYTYYIRHYNNNDPQGMGIMEFAIVRNNDYQVTINKIVSLGEDHPAVLGEDIEATMSYFQATLYVRPWVVRAQNATLG